jgi:hypothetical protein
MWAYAAGNYIALQLAAAYLDRWADWRIVSEWEMAIETNAEPLFILRRLTFLSLL